MLYNNVAKSTQTKLLEFGAARVRSKGLDDGDHASVAHDIFLATILAQNKCNTLSTKDDGDNLYLKNGLIARAYRTCEQHQDMAAYGQDIGLAIVRFHDLYALQNAPLKSTDSDVFLLRQSCYCQSRMFSQNTFDATSNVKRVETDLLHDSTAAFSRKKEEGGCADSTKHGCLDTRADRVVGRNRVERTILAAVYRQLTKAQHVRADGL